jgi:hypothetical protein
MRNQKFQTSDKIKCANCKKSHTANFKNCDERIEYLKRLRKIQNRNRKTHPTQNSTNFYSVFTPELYNANFPSLQNNVSRDIPAWITPQHKNFSNKNLNSDLFSPVQCMDIFNEFIGKLNCGQTKIDQIKVIAEITFKYIT